MRPNMARVFMSVIGALVFGAFNANASSVVRANSARASDDISFDQLAQKLELIRNQMDLTIENHQSVESDVRRQNMELKGLDVFLRVPLSSSEPKDDKVLLSSIRKDLEQTAVAGSSFRIHSLKFATKWKVAPQKVPATVPFDVGYHAPENQIVDSRDLQLEIEFNNKTPEDAASWFTEQQTHVRRLLTAVEPRSWQKKAKRLHVRAQIYRFRDFEYPKFTAPNLGRYKVPHEPSTQSQTASVQRIQRYRQQINELWPKTQAHLDGLRAFALNDLRMSFYLKHAKPHTH